MTASTEPRTMTVESADDGARLDRFLASRLDLPRNRVARWIAEGWVAVGDQMARKPSHRLRDGDVVVATPSEPPSSTRIAPQAGALDILYSDDDLLVLDKPAGLTVHPGAGRPDGTLANRLLAHDPKLATVGGPGRPGIVHRLDKDTTGVMVIARSDRAFRALSAAFAERTVGKRYLAIVHGAPEPATGHIDLAIARHPNDRTRMTVRGGGRHAETGYRVLAAAGPCSLVALELLTGRTHQIRVHMKAIGHPLVGDPVYGENRWRAAHASLRRVLSRFARPALHAHRLAFDHPVTATRLAFEAPPPDDLVGLWDDLGGTWPPALRNETV